MRRSSDENAIHIAAPGPVPVGHGGERDSNGRPVSRFSMDGRLVIVHHDDIADQDRTVVDGIPCTTVVRTIIDLAPDLRPAELDRMIDDALGRHLCTLAEIHGRIAEDDMRRRPAPELFRRSLHRLGHR